ncbi:response regulator [Telluribacter sp.]|jgi:CheY-like chemotaxis protein|uniref:response regulator transcription factor n=1 Tax=Telluribacter sp. TaxID=1978767 RepID=UPI002E14FAFF|nr:response regulator [Telluribacter sp.]
MIKNLLLIDDDEITLKILKLLIVRQHFAENIITRKNGKEGLDYFDELSTQPGADEVPDLILLDINMPVMNGWDFLDDYSQRFETKFPNTKVCMLSSTVDPADFQKASNYACVISFVSKPLLMSEVEMLRKLEPLRHFFEPSLS